VGVQVAVSLILLIGAGLFLRSLASVREVDPGVDVDRLAILGVNASTAGSGTPEADALLFREIGEGVAGLPGVESVALTTRLPVQPGGSTTTEIEGFDPQAGTGAVELPFAFVSPNFFSTLGMTLLGGRTFSAEDRPENPRAIIVNETAAQRFWGGNALGGRTRAQGGTVWREVVGVVSDAKVGNLREAPTPMMYFSIEQVPQACCFILARTTGAPDAILPAMREVLARLAPRVPANRLGTFESYLGEGFAASQAAAGLMGAFSLLALILASFGIYAVVSFAAARRASEFGIRMALGASRARVVGTAVRGFLLTCGIGVGIGLTVAMVLAPRVQGLLFGVASADPATFVGAALLLLAASLAASLVPAWRATRLDPVETLRVQ
jgi:predicted permease